MWEVLVGIISAICGPIITYVILKRQITDQAIAEKLHNLCLEIRENEQLRNDIYGIGYIVGAGIGKGVGLGGKGGKLKIEDILLQFGMKALGMDKPQQPESNMFGQTQ